MHNVVMISEESGTTLTVDSVVVAQGDIHMTVDNSRDIARFDAMRLSPPVVSVSLWYDKDKGPQLILHTTGQDFAAAKEKLIQLRDRLTQEIENGPSMCPFSTEKKTNTGSASQLASRLSSQQILANTAKEAGFIFPDTYSEQAIQLLLDGDAEAIRAAAEQVHEWQDLRDNGPVLCEWDAGSQQLRKRPYAATPKEQEATHVPGNKQKAD